MDPVTSFDVPILNHTQILIVMLGKLLSLLSLDRRILKYYYIKYIIINHDNDNTR